MIRKHPPGRGNARQPGALSPATGTTREQNQHTMTQDPTTVYHYTTLETAAALARASAAHLDEELSARRASGDLPTRELCQLLPVARFVHEQLAALAAQEGGQ
jgi:hypothetical protein